MIVVGSRLRGNETRNNKMPLPRPLFQIDVEPAQGGRNYPVDGLLCGDAAGDAAGASGPSSRQAADRPAAALRHRRGPREIGRRAARAPRALSGGRRSSAGGGAAGRSPMGAGRDDLELHLRQPLRPDRGAASWRPRPGRRHRAGDRHGHRGGGGIRGAHHRAGGRRRGAAWPCRADHGGRRGPADHLSC